MYRKFKRQKSKIRKRVLLVAAEIPKIQVPTSQKIENHPLGMDCNLFRCCEIDQQGNYIKVVNVSLTLEWEGRSYTIARLDSEHGYLHLHLLVSMQDPTELEIFVTNIGTPHDWLTLANRIIYDNFWEFRRDFLLKSGVNEYDY